MDDENESGTTEKINLNGFCGEISANYNIKLRKNKIIIIEDGKP